VCRAERAASVGDLVGERQEDDPSPITGFVAHERRARQRTPVGIDGTRLLLRRRFAPVVPVDLSDRDEFGRLVEGRPIAVAVDGDGEQRVRLLQVRERAFQLLRRDDMSIGWPLQCSECSCPGTVARDGVRQSHGSSPESIRPTSCALDETPGRSGILKPAPT
jgi:hypothetical protein